MNKVQQMGVTRDGNQRWHKTWQAEDNYSLTRQRLPDKLQVQIFHNNSGFHCPYLLCPLKRHLFAVSSTIHLETVRHLERQIYARQPYKGSVPTPRHRAHHV